MESNKKKQARRTRIRLGIRRKIKGSTAKPRLTVFRSNKEIYAQIIDDNNGVTLVTSSSLEKEFDRKGLNKTQVAAQVGKNVAEKAKAASIENVVFDRNGYLYHGRVKALADGAREGGLKF